MMCKVLFHVDCDTEPMKRIYLLSLTQANAACYNSTLHSTLIAITIELK